jgi:hypothetical protein
VCTNATVARECGAMGVVRAPTWALAVATATLLACAPIIGADEGTLAAATTDSGGVHADADCTQVTIDELDGVFVAPGGTTSPGCGDEGAPCSTVQLGLDRAAADGKSTVHVARGTYTESIVLRPGVTLDGALDLVAGAWVPVCTGDSAGASIQGTSGVTVTANALAAPATLASLTILGADPASIAPGESLIGVLATGPTTRLVLRDVIVTVGDAGQGQRGVAGANGTAGASGCAASDGAAGATPGAEGQPAASGAFSSGGFAPGSGDAGGVGSAGHAGIPGGGPQCVSCVTCVSTMLSCTAQSAAPSCGVVGLSGCGGAGGQAGGGGSGGGSSVALFAWDATVDVIGGTLQAGSGGAGGSGGPGGVGGAGGAGSAGSAGPSCATSCSAQALSCAPSSSGAGAASSSGGAGGAGSAGGAGGGGAGGSSYAIYQGGTGTVDASPSTLLVHGGAGAGVGGAASGSTADRYP